jgi:hypothetical protein
MNKNNEYNNKTRTTGTTMKENNEYNNKTRTTVPQ